MRRKTLDLILTAGGAVLTVILVAAGALLLWGNSYSNDQVHSQLALQQVYFPTKAQLAHPTGHEVTKTMIPYLAPYAGQEVTTGQQAQTYATHFIRVHLSEMPYGGVYAKVSAASRAKPSTAALAAEVQTVFQGTTLRAMLLEAYGFSIFGALAFDGALAAFCAAALMLVLTGMGLWHIQRTPLDEEFPKSLSRSINKVA
jgi:hypothetical protein